MSTDRELLKLAARSVGSIWSDYPQSHIPNEWLSEHSDRIWRPWDPLSNDGDALRLAVKLGIDVYADVPSDRPGAPNCAEAQRGDVLIIEDFDAHNGDIYAATRRAIVRAAAEIGRNMK